MSPLLVSFMPLPVVASVMTALSQSNMAGKVIIAILFIGSIGAWSVMAFKMSELRRARIQTRRFLQSFRKGSHPLAVFLKRAEFPDSPLYRVYMQGCSALSMELEGSGTSSEDLFSSHESLSQDLSASQLDLVRNAVERCVADEALMLESSMGYLATAVSTAPFLGLLGTVWGVMDSFGGMAVTGSATLGAVAPGIAGALLTTIVGLIVALPSAVGYNLLTNQIRSLVVQTDNFAQELASGIRRQFGAE